MKNNTNIQKINVALKIIYLSLLIFSLLIIVIFYTSKNDLGHGNFDMNLECMGGHETFLLLEKDAAYEHCPGHREKKRIGRIERKSNSATVFDDRDNQAWVKISWIANNHTITLLKKSDVSSMIGLSPVRSDLNQVNNPLRVWIPSLLPGD